MEGREEPLSGTGTTSSTDLELVALGNLQCFQPSSQPSASQPSSQPSASQPSSQPSASTSTAPLRDCKLILQNKEDYKSPGIQRVQWKTLHYLLQVNLLKNAITSFSSCTHQKLTDAFLTILMTNMQGRILKGKLKDTNGMRQGRSCSIQRMTNFKIVSAIPGHSFL